MKRVSVRDDWFRRSLPSLMLLCMTALHSPSSAHGIHGHIHVTAWAVDGLPDGELKDFLADAELRNALLFGAVFPDTGSIIGDDYGEIAHWEHFVDAFIAHLRESPEGYTTRSAQKRVAFLMGVAAHGLQDEIFDTLFLGLAETHDQQDQTTIDTATDAFLHADGYLVESVTPDYPVTLLVDLYQNALDYEVSEAVLDQGISLTSHYVISIADVAPAFDARLRPQMSWTSTHYDDPVIAGSLASEVPATTAYLEAIWERLNGRWDGANPVIYAYPDGDNVLADFHADRVESAITLIFGAGIRYGSVSSDSFQLYDQNDGMVPTNTRFTRWRSDDDALGRVLSLVPRADLQPESNYTTILRPGIEQANGMLSSVKWESEIRTPCDDSNPTCEPEPSRSWRPPQRPSFAGDEAQNESDRFVRENMGGAQRAPHAPSNHRSRPDETATGGTEGHLSAGNQSQHRASSPSSTGAQCSASAYGARRGVSPLILLAIMLSRTWVTGRRSRRF